MAASNRSIVRLAAQTVRSRRPIASDSCTFAIAATVSAGRLSQPPQQHQQLRQTAFVASPTRPLAVNLTSLFLRQTQTRRYSQEGSAPPAEGEPGGEGKIWSFDDVKALIYGGGKGKSDVIIVDAREPSELQDTGRIPGAVNIPITTQPDSFHITEDEFEDRFGYPRPDKDTEVVFYCKAGVRSRAAAQLARSAGWKRTGEYPGSWLDWVAKGGKVQR